MEVVRIMMNSRFSKITEETSAPESDETLEGSIFPLIMADISSNGETLIEFVEEDDEDCMIGNGEPDELHGEGTGGGGGCGGGELEKISLTQSRVIARWFSVWWCR